MNATLRQTLRAAARSDALAAMVEIPDIWLGSDEATRRRTWFVLHVKPRTEKKAVIFLRKFGCFYHLPLYLKITKVQRRKVRRELPLFPGYVFTKLAAKDRLEMLRTNLVVNAIYVKYPRKMIHQLRQIAHAARGRPALTPMKHMFKEGDLVRVKYGMFRGVEGYVKREGAHATLCMNVDVLGVSAEMSISPADLEKVE